MHRSRLCAIGIDCRVDDLDSAATFWSRALGRTEIRTDGAYATLGTGKEDLITFVQRVDHPSRVHIDIETDDVDAEVARLEALGAKRVTKVKSWWVMEAPTGHRFCVVRPQRGVSEGHWNEWP
jgi:predicted enzyme related to lactoylglutathione lyase